MRGVKLYSGLGDLELDATPSQQHQREVDVTEHPVETGAAVTDHVRQKPRSVRIEGVSLSPDAYALLNRLMDGAHLVVVRTELETYEKMILSSLSVPRDPQTGEALRFSATFRRIVFATSQRVTVNLPKAKVARGKQPTKPTSPETKQKAEQKKKGGIYSFVKRKVS